MALPAAKTKRFVTSSGSSSSRHFWANTTFAAGVLALFLVLQYVDVDVSRVHEPIRAHLSRLSVVIGTSSGGNATSSPPADEQRDEQQQGGKQPDDSQPEEQPGEEEQQQGEEEQQQGEQEDKGEQQQEEEEQQQEAEGEEEQQEGADADKDKEEKDPTKPAAAAGDDDVFAGPSLNVDQLPSIFNLLTEHADENSWLPKVEL